MYVRCNSGVTVLNAELFKISRVRGDFSESIL